MLFRSTLGRVMLNGRLPTGVLARQTTRVSPDGVWPLYVPFRDGHALIGWVTLQDPVTGSVDADIHWLTRGAP